MIGRAVQWWSLAVAFLCGCYARSLRVSLAPTVTTGGRVGLIASFGGGVGLQIEEGKRRNYALFGIGTISAGLTDIAHPTGALLAQGGFDYEEFFEQWTFRTGIHGVIGGLFGPTVMAGGLGARVGFLPQLRVRRDPYGKATHWLLGVELSADYLKGIPLLWGDPFPSGFGIFGLGVTFERVTEGGGGC